MKGVERSIVNTMSGWRALRCSTRPVSPASGGVGPAGVEPASNRLSDGCLAARSTARSRAPGGSRTRLSALARQCLYRSATGTVPHHCSSWGAGSRTPSSWFRARRDYPLHHTPVNLSSWRSSGGMFTPVSRILFYAIISLMHLPDHRRPAHRLRSIWLAPSQVRTILARRLSLPG